MMQAKPIIDSTNSIRAGNYKYVRGFGIISTYI